MNDKNRKIAILIAAILGCVGLFYLGGMLGQLLGNYAAWMDSGGVSGENTMKPVSCNPLICFPGERDQRHPDDPADRRCHLRLCEASR